MTETRTERMIVRRYLENEPGLDAAQRERIAACYLDHQSAEEAAGAAHLSPLTTRMISSGAAWINSAAAARASS